MAQTGSGGAAVTVRMPSNQFQRVLTAAKTGGVAGARRRRGLTATATVNPYPPLALRARREFDFSDLIRLFDPNIARSMRISRTACPHLLRLKVSSERLIRATPRSPPEPTPP